MVIEKPDRESPQWMNKFWTIFKRVAVNLARWKCRVLAWCPSYDLLGRSDQQDASIVTVGERHWRLHIESSRLYTSLDPRFKVVRHRCCALWCKWWIGNSFSSRKQLNRHENVLISHWSWVFWARCPVCLHHGWYTSFVGLVNICLFFIWCERERFLFNDAVSC